MISNLVVTSIIAQEGYHHLLYDVCMQCLVINSFRLLKTTFDGYIVLTAAIYYFRRLYTTCDGYIYFRRLYTNFDGYILLLALPESGFVRTQDLLAIYRTYELKASLKFSIKLLAIIPFCFFCVSIISSIIFSVPF